MKRTTSNNRQSRLKLLLTSKHGQILLSCLLGLGLATIFRRACKSGNCVVHRIPNRSDFHEKVFKEDGNCFKVSLNESKCDSNKEIHQLGNWFIILSLSAPSVLFALFTLFDFQISKITYWNNWNIFALKYITCVSTSNSSYYILYVYHIYYVRYHKHYGYTHPAPQ